MAGVKGRSGKGKDKPWAEALRMVGYREERKRLLAIAEQCFAAAEAGDIQAMKEIGDRLDGKPVQENMTELTHRYVARVPEKAPDAIEWQKTYSPQTIQ